MPRTSSRPRLRPAREADQIREQHRDNAGSSKCGEAVCASEAVHCIQNLALSGFCSPHTAQTFTPRVYETSAADPNAPRTTLQAHARLGHPELRREPEEGELARGGLRAKAAGAAESRCTPLHSHRRASTCSVRRRRISCTSAAAMRAPHRGRVRVRRMPVWVQDALTEAKEVTGVHGDGREHFVDPAGVWSPDSPRGGRVGVRGRLPVSGQRGSDELLLRPAAVPLPTASATSILRHDPACYRPSNRSPWPTLQALEHQALGSEVEPVSALHWRSSRPRSRVGTAFQHTP